jgi:hypothetical protein
MTAAADVTVLAHHGLLLAIPAFAPAIAVVGVVTYIAMRDRRQGDDQPDSEHSATPDKDGTA